MIDSLGIKRHPGGAVGAIQRAAQAVNSRPPGQSGGAARVRGSGQTPNLLCATSKTMSAGPSPRLPRSARSLLVACRPVVHGHVTERGDTCETGADQKKNHKTDRAP